MEKLKSQLRSDLAGNPNVSILKDAVWQLPIASYDVSFDRVKRLKMDILMKMLLLAFQETEIRRAAALAEMLFVEELFIGDLIEKMVRTQLIQLEKKGYQLTAKGYSYLEKGIFEEEMDGDQTLVSYSVVHDEYQLLEKDSLAVDDELPIYRYAVEGTSDINRIHELLSKEKNSTEENFQVIVTEITELEESESYYIPCVEFQLYDQEQNIFYARVWNTGTGSWDEALEKQIEEKEIVEWRETMEGREASLS